MSNSARSHGAGRTQPTTPAAAAPHGMPPMNRRLLHAFALGEVRSLQAAENPVATELDDPALHRKLALLTGNASMVLPRYRVAALRSRGGPERRLDVVEVLAPVRCA